MTSPSRIPDELRTEAIIPPRRGEAFIVWTILAITFFALACMIWEMLA